ncbi:MAG TPA: hypothetical protein VE621_10395 [Bryobacteraceae bacterium]|nr:hypothetical protein [Bryobacteraceae bacterium]
MALFVDGPIASAEDLRRYESSILDVMSVEKIELGAKLDIAHRELAVELTAFLVRQETLTGSNRDLGHVVVTEALSQWHALHTLSLIYRDAYNSQLNDRYQGKWQEYSRLSRASSSRFFEIGVGLSRSPLPRAARPLVMTVPGSAVAPGTYYCRVAWCGDMSEIGGLSDLAEVAVGAGEVFAVEPGVAPPHARTWAVFAGTDPEDLVLQELVSVGSAWLPAEALEVATSASVMQQQPDHYVTSRRNLFRG